jgi:hypothetical protein
MGLETMGERRRFAMFNAPEQICRTQVVTDLVLNKAERIQTKAEQGPWNQSRVRAGSHQCRGDLDAAEVHYMCFGEFLFPSALVRPVEWTKETNKYPVLL